MTISGEEWRVISSVATIVAAVSLTYWFIRSMRSSVSELVMLMSISKLNSTIAYIIGRHGPSAGEDSFLCQLQGVLTQYGNLAYVLWTSFIALDLLLIMLRGYSIERVCRLHRRVYLPICLTIPLLVSLIPAGIRDTKGHFFYGSAGLWCWISEANGAYRLYLLYIPLWIIFAFNISSYVSVGCAIWKKSRMVRGAAESRRHVYILEYVKNVSLYLLAFLLAWLAPSINRGYLLATNQHVYALYMLHSLSSPATGIVDLVIYLYIWWKSGGHALWRSPLSSFRLRRPSATTIAGQAHISNGDTTYVASPMQQNAVMFKSKDQQAGVDVPPRLGILDNTGHFDPDVITAARESDAAENGNGQPPSIKRSRGAKGLAH
ncbi:slime mold cyclic AMP receptor-domain-containing protein [Thamnocephalis sphaerospora]|uniref:Slime mold cyclic AMP receptor-domain-containing protein n=1 Tax=Thamnocephalis sphaerospora TaxID=78915 RepID=A0A4P9XPJ6_9FUNG|nr:slime mold cyclic AMP receptor-domain-containing protein [Thamnocephalis sphaerospora]|eukprot:RKP07934.1 slime mold cyclic AMP receptor-domain-containing protein [Thamnocephalis sphaerospora]